MSQSEYIRRAKLRPHLDRIVQIAEGKRPPPVNVEIDLSNRCNLGCEWCHFAHTHTRGPHSRAARPDDFVGTGDLMNTELAKHIVLELAEYGVRSITWSGGGEPTLHPAFREIVTYTPLPQGIYTNGVMIQDITGTLKQHFDWIYISLDAANAEEYAQAKGVNKRQFWNAYDNVVALVAEPGPATIGLGMLLTENNWSGIDEMVLVARDLGVDYVQFRPTINYQLHNPGQPASSRGWVYDAVRKLREYEHDPLVVADLGRFVMYAEWTQHPYPVCWWSGLQTVITPDGRVWTCVNKRGQEGALLGDLTQNTVVEIWEQSTLPGVNEKCRIMCRGHLPNVTLQPLMTESEQHKEFI